ncbi:16S rRNA (uracil1498-N3)-methyltransferase [Elusimicrobium simillimum]|uniref:RsmE family RNA methyltransferase n=1 Tax=Elusimicrobium simillimum TaxID=3143438 RepID=UPI003C6F2E0D
MPQYLADINADIFTITGDEAKHLAAAMRAQAGDSIKIFDGNGKKFAAVIKNVSKSLVSGTIERELPVKLPYYNLTLCFAPVGRGEVEEILDKGTQLGVSRFLPIITARTEHDVIKKWDSKKDRWESIILAAVKQCETGNIPALLAPVKFAAALENDGVNIMAYEREEATTLLSALGQEKSINIFIGPVGGFTDEEAALALSKGAKLCTLGVNIMRAETAAIAAAAITLQKSY